MVSATVQGPSKARVLLVEDHPVVRHGLASLIDDETDLQVVALAENSARALDFLGSGRADVVIIDITLGEENGLDLIKDIHEKLPDLPILALSMHDESLYAERALRAGAKGYIMKKEAMDLVMNAIRQLLAGETYVSTKMASKMVNKLVGGAGKATSDLERLSDREFEVFSFIAKGVGPSEIATRLGVSVKTVETHREHIKSKLKLKTAADLTRYALTWSMNR